MNLIFCVGDMGLSHALNMGVLKAIDDGVVTTARVLLDMPGTVNALEELKKRPWITLIWQPQSLPESNDDLYRKWSEDVEGCIRTYGRAPFAAEFEGVNSSADVLRAVCNQYGINYDYHARYDIREYDVSGGTGVTFDTYRSYDPFTGIREIQDAGSAAMCTLYPGYLDDYMLNTTLRGGDSIRNIHRLQDVLVLCADSLKNWIIENDVKLVSLSDVIRNRCDYQNRLKADSNALAVRERRKI